MPAWACWCRRGLVFPSTFGFGQIRWCMKSLLWHFLPSPGGLSQTRWNGKACSGTFFHRPVVYLKPDGLGKSFFSKIHPSPKGIFQPRWLNRASGFHRPRNSLSVDGTKSRDQVWNVEDFHHGRNFQSVDGVYSQRQALSTPSGLIKLVRRWGIPTQQAFFIPSGLKKLVRRWGIPTQQAFSSHQI